MTDDICRESLIHALSCGAHTLRTPLWVIKCAVEDAGEGSRLEPAELNDALMSVDKIEKAAKVLAGWASAARQPIVKAAVSSCLPDETWRLENEAGQEAEFELRPSVVRKFLRIARLFAAAGNPTSAEHGDVSVRCEASSLILEASFGYSSAPYFPADVWEVIGRGESLLVLELVLGTALLSAESIHPRFLIASDRRVSGLVLRHR